MEHPERSVPQVGKTRQNNGQRKPPLTPPRGEDLRPARQMGNSLQCFNRNTSLKIGQLCQRLEDASKDLLGSQFGITFMLLGGFGNGPSAHTGPYWLGAGASLARGISSANAWSSGPNSEAQSFPTSFVGTGCAICFFLVKKKRKKKQNRFFVTFSSEKVNPTC